MNKRTGFRFMFTVIALATVYLYLLFSKNEFIEKWRTIYIETAMSTNSHQWLAEWFVPPSIIEEVMSERREQQEEQAALQSSWENMESAVTKAAESAAGLTSETEQAENMEEVVFYERYWELDCESFRNYLTEHKSVLSNGYGQIEIYNFDNSAEIKTRQGDCLLALDTANNTMIIGVSGDGFVGKLAVIKNTEQVTMQTSAYYGTKGETADIYSDRYDAEVVVNASGFKDVGGHGSGGTIKGAYVIDGKENGSPRNGHWKFAGVKTDGRMYIENRKNADITDYKWGIEFYPALIVDGKNVIDGSYCMGIQPRTTIGQTPQGDMLLLVIDGRQIGYSLGCSVADCEEILSAYNACQAMNLDGGSSSVMYYKGKMVTRPSSVSGKGRYMPNAIVVKKVSDL